MKITVAKRPWILSRTACLGNYIFPMLPVNYARFNIQKGRADYLVNATVENAPIVKPSFIYNFLRRKDLLPEIFEQKNINLLRSKLKPSFIYIDSYSELTDQLFIHIKEEFRFCLNYTDMQVENIETWKNYRCVGLLPLEDIKDQYEKLFSCLRSSYTTTPIIFIHFPVKLDEREKFRRRGKAIQKAIHEIKNKYQPFYEFKIDESEVKHHPDDVFPYHFSHSTYTSIADQIIDSGVFNNL